MRAGTPRFRLPSHDAVRPLFAHGCDVRCRHAFKRARTCEPPGAIAWPSPPGVASRRASDCGISEQRTRLLAGEAPDWPRAEVVRLSRTQSPFPKKVAGEPDESSGVWTGAIPSAGGGRVLWFDCAA